MSRARTNKENRPKRPSTLGLLLGGTGGRKDASKGAEAERQRRRRERDRSREMAAYVGYDAMYKDGIAQVMPGVFSQTVEFSDISYQSARKEARETAFTVMSSLFNYFPADSHVQLQVVNAPIPADEVGRKVFFEPGDHLPRAVSDLAHERQVGESVGAYGLGELGYAGRVHGVRGVRRVVGDVCHRDLGHRVAPAGARRAVEQPRDGEARGHLARRAHGTPRRREPRSRARGGFPARMPPPASTASCPRRPCCSRV